MASEKLFKLIAITALALFASSFGPTPVTALAAGTQHLNRHVAHDAIARRKRTDASSSRRCKTRPASSLSSTATPTTTQAPTSSKPTTTVHATTTTVIAPPPPPPSGGGRLLIGGGPDDPSTIMGYDSVMALYNWDTSFWGMDKLQGKPFWPMYWGSKSISGIQQIPKASSAQNLVFGQNEIDQSGQANQSPQQACDQYRQYVAPKANEGYALVAPSTSSAPQNDLQDFMNICGHDLGITAVQAHWYDTCPQKLIDWVTSIHTTTGSDVYLTEYAIANFRGSGFHGGADPSTDPNYVVQFHATTYPKLLALGFVKAISPFGFFSDAMPGGVHDNNRLITRGTSQPNSLGSMFLKNSFPAADPNFSFWCD